MHHVTGLKSSDHCKGLSHTTAPLRSFLWFVPFPLASSKVQQAGGHLCMPQSKLNSKGCTVLRTVECIFMHLTEIQNGRKQERIINRKTKSSQNE